MSSLPRRGFLALGGAALFSLGAAPPPAGPGPEKSVGGGSRVLALTFDDGPSPLFTPRVLAVLRRYRVPATFFMLGANAAAYPHVARQVAAEGHALGNHTWSHPNLDSLPLPEVRDQIGRTRDLLAEVSARPSVLFRAPGGHFSPHALTVCREFGLRPIGWSVDPRDWSNPGVGRITRTVLDGARGGAIVLQHDSVLIRGFVPEHEGRADRSQTVEALKIFLPRLLDAGYEFTTPDAHPPAARAG